MLGLFKQEHPRGLYLLFFVEMWERFSFYGMRALLVLYMVQELLYSSQKAGNIYGIYTGLVYLTPLIGGYLADRYFGQRKCITAGAILMASGLFLLASGIHSLFIPALFLMITANGCFKSNISSVLGLLYGNDNTKKDSAFTIFYMGINFGAFLSPIICGTVAYKLGFTYGFGTAGAGMLIGLIIYKLFENKLLGNYGMLPSRSVKNDVVINENIEYKKLFALFILMLFTIPFWICFEQAGSSLTLFAEYQTNRALWGHEIPTGYFQSLNPLFIITLAPIFSLFWDFLRSKHKEPTSVEKFVIAMFLMTISYLILMYAGVLSVTSKISPLWLVLAYFVMTLSELCLSPIGLSLVSKLAPKKFLSLTMGLWFFTCFIGDTLSGIWGGRYAALTPVELFTPLASIAFIDFFLLLLLTPKLNKMLKM